MATKHLPKDIVSASAVNDIITIDQLPEQKVLSRADWIVVLKNSTKKMGKTSFESVVELLKGDFYTKEEIVRLVRGAEPFDGQRPITAQIPGLTGLVLGGSTIGEVTGNLVRSLYPALAPTASLAATNPEREFGASNFTMLNYNVNPGGNELATIVVDGVAIDIATPQGFLSSNTVQDVDKRFSMTATDKKGLSVEAAVDVRYFHNRFWFQNAQNLLAASEQDLSVLLQTQANKEFITNNSRSQSRTFALTNQYTYFAYPTSLGAATFVVGGLPNTAYQLRAFQYTNVNGFVTTYNLYRSGNAGTGTIGVVLQ